MRDRFSELIKQGVAEFKYKAVAPRIPEQDPICRMYNNIWSIASDTHMSLIGDGIRVITGHKIGIQKDWDVFINSCFWGAVDFRGSGYYCVNDFLYKNGLEGHYDVINNDNVYLITPIKSEKKKREAHKIKEAKKSKEDLRGDVYNAIGDVAFTYEKAGIKLTEDDWEDAIDWVKDKFLEN